MPTPSPIITPRKGAKSGIVSRWDRIVTRTEPATMPASATPIGRPMASTEPKATTRITTANAMPSVADDGDVGIGGDAPEHGEGGLHGGPHLRVRDAVVGLEDDRPVGAGPEALELRLQRVEAAGALEPGRAEVLTEVAPHRAGEGRDDG